MPFGSTDTDHYRDKKVPFDFPPPRGDPNDRKNLLLIDATWMIVNRLYPLAMDIGL